MPKTIIIIIIIIVAINVTFLFIYLNKSSGNSQNLTVVPNESSRVLPPPPQNVSNQSMNLSSVYESNCINSTKKHVEDLENITNLTLIETKIFDKESNVKSYLQHNWSNNFYDINGMIKDITNKTVVSVFEIITNRERNFTLPILCDQNGKIGNYSSCLLNNIPNIPSSCYNFTINLTECELEWLNHFVLDDIQYWVIPTGGALLISSLGVNNTSQKFNFTINSSRKMLESFGMNVIERTFVPIINDDVIFSSTKLTSDGKGGSIVTNVNITGKKGVEFYATVWFKKKCYDKYVIY